MFGAAGRGLAAASFVSRDAALLDPAGMRPGRRASQGGGGSEEVLHILEERDFPAVSEVCSLSYLAAVSAIDQAAQDAPSGEGGHSVAASLPNDAGT